MRIYTSFFRFAQVMLIATCFTACGGGSSSGGMDNNMPPPMQCSRNTIANSLTSDLAALSTDTDFSLYIERFSGETYQFNRGASLLTTPYESASTSKWVSATVILWLVDQGLLALTSKPQDLLNDWPLVNHPTLNAITLHHLLNFTSGLNNEPLCQNLPNVNFWQCVNRIAIENDNSTQVPGEVFEYASTHMQVAGAMAVKAAGVESWEELFLWFKTETGLFANGQYNRPSVENPRLAGGMTWTGEDYIHFLHYFNNIFHNNPNSAIALAGSDKIEDAVIGNSPAISGINEDWHYGYGLWIECHEPSFNTANCEPANSLSSPGAFGAYPFIHLEENYLGIIAQQGALGSFRQGYSVFESIRARASEWAACENL